MPAQPESRPILHQKIRLPGRSSRNSPSAHCRHSEGCSGPAMRDISRQPSLVARKRQLLPVVVQRMQIAEGLARNLERLGPERKAKTLDLAAALAAMHRDGGALAGRRPAGTTSRE